MEESTKNAPSFLCMTMFLMLSDTVRAATTDTVLRSVSCPTYSDCQHVPDFEMPDLESTVVVVATSFSC